MHSRDYRLLDIFVVVVESGSLTHAARRLHVSTPVISQAIDDLECSVGCSLLVRQRGRKIEVTQSGQYLYEHAAPMRLQAQRAMGALKQYSNDKNATVSITMPTELSVNWFPDFYAHFCSQYPKINLQLEASDKVVDLRNSIHQVAIRAEFILQRKGVEKYTLGYEPLVLVGSNKVVEQIGCKKSGALFPLIGYSRMRSSKNQSSTLISVIESYTGEQKQLAFKVGIHVNSSIIALELARKDMGLALVMQKTAMPYFEKGELFMALPEFDFGYVGVFSVFRDAMPDVATQLFVDFCEQMAFS